MRVLLDPDTLFIVVLVSMIYALVLFLLKKRNIQLPLHPICLGIFIVYIAELLFLTMLPNYPLEFYREMYPELSISDYYNLIPFSNLLSDTQFLSNMLKEMFENGLLFIPFGFLYNFTFVSKSFKQILLRGFLFTLSIETMQLLISLLLIQAPYRYFDINDLIMNSLGVIIGYGAWYAVNCIIKKT